MPTGAGRKGEGGILVIGTGALEQTAAHVLKRAGYEVRTQTAAPFPPETSESSDMGSRSTAVGSWASPRNMDAEIEDGEISILVCSGCVAAGAMSDPTSPGSRTSARGSIPIAALRSLRRAYPGSDLVLLTPENAPPEVFQEATEVLKAPFPPERLLRAAELCYERRALRSANDRLHVALDEAWRVRDLVAVCSAMRRVRDLAELVAQKLSPALVAGEPGTGKEVLARFVHRAGPRRDGPFVRISCAAAGDDPSLAELIAAHLRADVPSFPASEPVRRIEAVRQGTLFLDGIEETSRPFQERLFVSLDGRPDRELPHVIASTNSELEVARRNLHPGLYDRFSRGLLRLPPLRERRDDIPVLASSFCVRLAEKHAKHIQGIAPGAMSRLIGYSWPGNVRELENAIERAVILCRGLTLLEDDLPEPLLAAAAGNEVRIPIGTSMEEAQSILIRATLRFTGGNKERAARVLGIASRTIHRRVGPNRPRSHRSTGSVSPTE